MSEEDEFCDRILEGGCSDDEIRVFQEWLDQPEHLECFARRAELHADLRRLLLREHIQGNAIDSFDGLESDDASNEQRVMSAPTGLGRVLLTPVVGLAVAACVLVLLIPRWYARQDAPSQVVAARIAGIVDSRITCDGREWEQPDLPVGQYELHEGLLHLQCDGGVTVYMEAPARFQLVNGKRILLHDGRLSANVPPAGVGFTVDTPEAEVVDFGTEFSVDVEDGNSEVHVFEGLVRVQPTHRENASDVQTFDVRGDQAIRINQSSGQPTEIKLARDRFIRGFEEPRRSYSRLLKQLSPDVSYRMAIRDQGLNATPMEYSGVVLTGKGRRPPHARGVFAGGSLRVGADSSGRGGRVDQFPLLETGQFSVVVFVYLDELDASETERTIMTKGAVLSGCFELSMDAEKHVNATVCGNGGEIANVTSTVPLTQQTWRHLAVTVDGDQLKLFEDGQLVAQSPCESTVTSDSQTVWFGTKPNGSDLWSGRIDEVAWFNRSLHDEEIEALYAAGQREIKASR